MPLNLGTLNVGCSHQRVTSRFHEHHFQFPVEIGADFYKALNDRSKDFAPAQMENADLIANRLMETKRQGGNVRETTPRTLVRDIGIGGFANLLGVGIAVVRCC